MEKTCSACRELKGVDCFSRDKQNSSGLAAYCRECRKKRSQKSRENPELRERHRIASIEWYRSHLEEARITRQIYLSSEKGKSALRRSCQKWDKSETGKLWRKKYRAANAHKVAARLAVRNAITDRQIARPDNCSQCGSQCKPDGHHHKGYDKANWLDVVWLCRKCHRHHEEKLGTYPTPTFKLRQKYAIKAMD